MVKRVFKNKRLIRNILILAGLVIVGFFVWRAFFWTRLLEGNAGANPGSATATCPPGTSIINKTYPGEEMSDLPIGQSDCKQALGDNWINDKDGEGLPRCRFPNWSADRAACNIHIDTWAKCANGQAQYNACINS